MRYSGPGRMGGRHAENLATLAQGELAWICDVDLEAARALADRCGGRASDSAEEVLAAADTEAVIIASPTGTHVDLMLAAADAGKPGPLRKAD